MYATLCSACNFWQDLLLKDFNIVIDYYNYHYFSCPDMINKLSGQQYVYSKMLIDAIDDYDENDDNYCLL